MSGDNQIHIVTYTDRHVRMAGKALNKSGVVWHHKRTKRMKQIIDTMKRYGVRNKLQLFNPEAFFDRVINSTDTFLIIGRIGQKGYTTKMFHCESLFEMLKLTSDGISGRLITMDESLFYYRRHLEHKAMSHIPQFEPFSKIFLTKSRTEHGHYSKIFPNKKVVLVGQAELDATGYMSGRKPNVAILLATVSEKKKRNLIRLKRDFRDFVKKNTFSGTVYIKDHINGRSKFGEIREIKKLCKNLGLKYVVVDRRESIFSVAQHINFAFIHETINSHFLLHRMGVESFFYPDGIAEIKKEFLIKSRAPDYTYSDRVKGKISKKEYDKWMEHEFCLDGKTKTRLWNILKGT